MDKKKLYEFLGAKWFQKVVLGLEKLKFKVIDKVFPNNKLYNIFEKIIDKNKNRSLKKVINEEQKMIILNKYKYKKMKLKRQLVNCQNDNYHLNLINVDDFKKYLEWNKEVHKKGLIKNLIVILIAIPTVILTGELIFTIASIILGWNIFSGIINFECVNLQNYNLVRYEEKYERLKRAEENLGKRNIKKYKDANKVIAKTIEKSIDIPTINDIIESVQTEEEKKQIIKLIENEQRKRIKYEDDSINNGFHK